MCWVSSHTGISGCNQADKAARSTLNITPIKSLNDFKMKINENILQQRQQHWNNNKHKKLLEIKPTLG